MENRASQSPKAVRRTLIPIRKRPMDIPPLRSVLNPRAPEWTDLRVPPAELRNHRQQLALIVLEDHRDGELRILGSGFIILSTIEHTVHVVSASHVLLDACKYVVPDTPRGKMPGNLEEQLKDDEARIRKAIETKTIKVMVEVPGYDHRLHLDIVGVAMGIDERLADVAIIECGPLPDTTRREIIGDPVILDWEPVRTSEVVLMAGFAPPPRQKIALGDLEELDRIRRRHLVIRAGCIREITDQADGARAGAPLLRVNMPSEPGMSGGPILRIRIPGNRPAIIGAGAPGIPVGVGVISRGRLGGMFAHFENPAGETWATPLHVLLPLQLRILGEFYSFHVIAQWILISYQDIADHIASSPLLQRGETRNRKLDYLELLREKRARMQPMASGGPGPRDQAPPPSAEKKS